MLATIAMEAALALYRFVRWMNRCLAWLLAWFYRDAAYFYIVADDGTQLSLTAYNYAVFYPANLLVIYYTPSGTKYRFVPKLHDAQYLQETNRTAEAAIADIKSAYSRATVPKYKLLGIHVKVGSCEMNVAPDQFVVEGSTVFSVPFKRWLCRHYLHTPYAAMTVTIIDESIRLLTIDDEITFHRDKYLTKEE